MVSRGKREGHRRAKLKLQKVALSTIHRAKITTSQHPSQRGVWEERPQDSLRGQVGAVLISQCRVRARGVLPDLLTEDTGSEEPPLMRVKSVL